ncbi:DUF2927 domain-containing protein [Aestuariibius insulae]|uniref:DUF2927 domain-containing protein n=1 Tax=Aestuariibius insulae TaxID=2058287 RepID=UPI00345F13AB
MTPIRAAIASVCLAATVACAPLGGTATRAAVQPDLGSLPAMKTFARQAPPPVTRSNEDIARDILDLVFELESGRTVPRLTRFDGPITVRVIGASPPTLGPDLDRLIARLRTEARLDIRPTTGTASITIETMPKTRLQRAVPNAACFVVPGVSSWDEFRTHRNTARTDWTQLRARSRAAIFVPSDVSPQEIRDCLHEEMAQALGPLNDLYRLPDSVFNDDNMHAVLTGFDMLVLRAIYAPELANGMIRDDVARRLPALLRRLNPRGAGIPANQRIKPSRAWKGRIESALRDEGGRPRRLAAAQDAVTLATQAGWTGPRRGFSYYVLGRLQLATSPEAARRSFERAAISYAAPETAVQKAHVGVQLAALALRSGDAQRTLAITSEAIPIARSHENAALLSTLLMFQAEAEDLAGRRPQAAATRLDSLAWARYGFGRSEAVRARLTAISDLTPG